MRPGLRVRRCKSGYETLDGRYVIQRQDGTYQWHVWDNYAGGGCGDYADPAHSRGFTTQRAATIWFKGYLAETYRDAPDKLGLYLTEMMSR